MNAPVPTRAAAAAAAAMDVRIFIGSPQIVTIAVRGDLPAIFAAVPFPVKNLALEDCAKTGNGIIETMVHIGGHSKSGNPVAAAMPTAACLEGYPGAGLASCRRAGASRRRTAARGRWRCSAPEPSRAVCLLMMRANLDAPPAGGCDRKARRRNVSGAR